MPGTQRAVRSTAHTRPARAPQEPRRNVNRSQWQVIEGRPKYLSVDHMREVFVWIKTRSTPVVYVVLSVLFLFGSIVGSLYMRTQMAQTSFEMTRVRHSISRLQQDVDDAQAQLDSLQAQLPQKAQEMGMIAQRDAMSLDLQGYLAQ